MMYYDRQGKPLELMKWARLMEDLDYRHVGLTVFGPEGSYDLSRQEMRDQPPGAVKVSTVWLGLDHRLPFESQPIIFESMVFGGAYDELQWRYPTEELALAGHQRIVEALKAGRAPKHDDDPCASL